MKKSAPVAAIVAAVSASLTMSAPAAAATTSSWTAAKIGGGSLLSKLAAGASGALAGAALGAAGVMFGVRKNIANATDDQERVEWKRFGRIAVSIVIVAAFGIALSGFLESAFLLIVVQILFVGSLSVMYISWAPRIMKRRIDAEIARDPEAAKRIRRARLMSWVGLITGIAISSATVAWAAVALLRK